MLCVVSYRNSTSNHNIGPCSDLFQVLYLIEILHQTTTLNWAKTKPTWLYLIEILHQTTTKRVANSLDLGCILSKFYIKPQHFDFEKRINYVVSYRNSTSNHNAINGKSQRCCVVSYRNSTSNHNENSIVIWSSALYLIEILHQTTTSLSPPSAFVSCILSKFYIKPQRLSTHDTIL